MRRRLTSAQLRSGCRSRSSATAPVTYGADMLVPCIAAASSETRAHCGISASDACFDRAEMTHCPGPATSGLFCPSRVGPGLLKYEISSSLTASMASRCPPLDCHWLRVAYEPTVTAENDVPGIP